MTGNYVVGYKRPPKHTRFQKGQSGNPKGRPKGTKNLATDLAEELREKVLVKEGDRQRKISKQRAMVKSLLAKALKGDVRAATVVYTMISKLLETNEPDDVDVPLNAEELAVLQTLEEQILERAGLQKANTASSAPKLPTLPFEDV